MSRLAEIYILDVPFHADRAYTYYIPESLTDSAVPGSLCEVPFGRGNRRMTGVVASVRDGEASEGIKPVASSVGDGPVLDGEALSLCLFMKEYTLCTFGDAIRAVVPAGAMAKVITSYRVVRSTAQAFADAAGERGRLVFSLIGNRKSFTKQSLQSELDFDCTSAVRALFEAGVIEKVTEIRGGGAAKVRRLLVPSPLFGSDPEEWNRVADRLTGKNQRVLAEAVREAAEHGGSFEESVLEGETGLSQTAMRAAEKSLAERGLLAVKEEDDWRNPFDPELLLEEAEKSGAPEPLALTEEQTRAYETAAELLEKREPGAMLLHGVTGSGKTSVILAAIEKTLSMGRGAIMLVPEIALTPQTVNIFVRRFGNRVAVIHSGLSGGERYDAWRRIREGLADVVIGTRSAVFAPVPDLGLIVIDEEQEYTYKSDTAPKYRAHDIARFRCREHGAVMLLSSATPSISSYYKAKTGVYRLAVLKERYGNARLPDVEIVDMRDETAAGNLTPVSRRLADKLRADRDAGRQAILFLNRRGYNNYVSCRTCGKSIKCPECSVSLTYHTVRRRIDRIEREGGEYEETRRENGYLVCHMCGHREAVPKVCPDCGGEHFLFMGFGTQKAEDDVAALFPDLRILRMDTDTTSGKFSHERILSAFRRGEADVLLGTQMVTKGHDFPKVATVGVLNADSALCADDYRAAERTFAMLTQVIGRAGRADVPGLALIQTHNPLSEVLRLAAKQDYETFYESEIRLRRALTFPPFCDMATVTLSSPDETYLQVVTKRMYERVIEHTREDFRDVPMMLFGPFEAPVYRVQNACRMRLVFKCRLNRRMRALLSSLLTEFGKSSPRELAGGMVETKSARRISVSVDLNPSTI
ncbi:MAG: primosomal protein N' [Ruminococcaceae bacterium]|nr:primosomal protein N' [Oscillospiraceae bacterium]